jgi:hypothetical protein
MGRFLVTFTNSAGHKEQQTGGQYETIALLQRLPRLGAVAISVLAPNGDIWSSEETLQRLTAV